MGIARSTYYDQPTIAVSDTELVETMAEIAETFEAYGYRRMRAALRHRGLVVNHKKIRRLMREHDLQPKARRRFVATTHSDHDLPIFPNLANGMTIDGPNQLWVADLTYVEILAGFVYVAVILDAWSRRVVGYAISRSIDTRLAMAALRAAIRWRQPPPQTPRAAPRAAAQTRATAAQAHTTRRVTAAKWLVGMLATGMLATRGFDEYLLKGTSASSDPQ